jgi:hypothetical protein
MNFAIYPILQYPKTHFSNIPVFHYSNWGEAPNLYGNLYARRNPNQAFYLSDPGRMPP